MKGREIIPGILLLVLGVISVLIPKIILPVCSGQLELATGSTAPMKCHWMAQAELPISILIIAVSVLILALKNQQMQLILYVVITMLGLMVILVCTVFIGVCMASGMPCRMGTQPAMIIIGAMILFFSMIGVYSTYKTRIKPEDVRRP